MSHIFDANLLSLSKRSPAVAPRVSQLPTDGSVVAAVSTTGRPILERAGRALDSRRDPEAAADAQAASVEASQVALLGFGTGYLAEALLARGISLTTIVVDGPGPLAAAMRTRDLRHVLTRVPIVQIEDLRDPVDVATLRARAGDLVLHGPSLAESPDLRGLAAHWQAIPVADRPPRVVVVGPIAGGSLAVAESAAAGARACGADVTFFAAAEFAQAYRALGRHGAIGRNRPFRQGQLAQLIGDTVADVAIESGADLVLALAQAPLHTAALARLREAGIATAFWFVENHRVLTYWRDLASAYDWFYGIQPGEFLDRLHAAGATRPAYLPMACDPERHRPLTLGPDERERFGSDVSFAGAPYLNRRHVLSGLTDFDLRIWGPDWVDPALAPFVANGGQRFSCDEMVRIFSASTINLNLHSAAHVSGLDPQADYVNPRTFELAACRAFQLVDRRDPLPDLFDDDDLTTFSTIEELRGLIEHFLRAHDERESTAARAHARVLRDHTYAHRVERIFRDTLPAELVAAALVGERAETLDEAIARHEAAPVVCRDELLLRMVREVGQNHVNGARDVSNITRPALAGS